MSSKLHRRGLPADEAVVWEPSSKDGSRPVFNAREAGLSQGQPHSTDADERMREMERQSEAKVQAAYQRGLQEGETKGRQQGAAQVQPVLEQLARTLNELATLRPVLRHEAEQDVVKLAMAIAKRILYREMSTDPAALLGLVRSTLDKLDGREVHRVRANPQDAAALQGHFQKMGITRQIEVFPDGNLARGSAVFETAQGSLDASVETQLSEIERGFTDLMNNSA